MVKLFKHTISSFHPHAGFASPKHCTSYTNTTYTEKNKKNCCIISQWERYTCSFAHTLWSYCKGLSPPASPSPTGSHYLSYSLTSPSCSLLLSSLLSGWIRNSFACHCALPCERAIHCCRQRDLISPPNHRGLQLHYPPVFWQHALNANILKVNALSHTHRRKKKKKCIRRESGRCCLRLWTRVRPLVHLFPSCIEFQPRRFHCWAMNGMRTSTRVKRKENKIK